MNKNKRIASSVGSNDGSNDGSSDGLSGESQTPHKKCYNKQIKQILINHSNQSDIKRFSQILNGKSFDDNLCDIKFVVDTQEIASHSEVLQILSNQRQLVKDLVEKDKQLAKEQNCPEANIFQMSGTTGEAFSKLIQYVYSGKVECDLKTGIDLAITAHKLKFYPLEASIGEHLFINISDILRYDTVDDLYAIAKNINHKKFAQKCGEFMDKHAITLRDMFLKRDIKPNDSDNCLTYAYENTCHINYIHFLLPLSPEICFNVMVSQDRIKWNTVLRNENIWSKFWNWVYFQEMRVKYVRIVCTEIDDQNNGNNYNIKNLRDDTFLCKRINIELKFDPNTGYLEPKHDVIQYPIPYTKQIYDTDQKDGFTYVTSQASSKEKENYYYYHFVGEKSLEFYLPQTCLIDSIRFRLWDFDERTYNFTVEVRKEDETDEEISWVYIKGDKDNEFVERRSWQEIKFITQPIRWIRITGVKGPKHDREFALIHFECPSQLNQ